MQQIRITALLLFSSGALMACSNANVSVSGLITATSQAPIPGYSTNSAISTNLTGSGITLKARVTGMPTTALTGSGGVTLKQGALD